MHQIYQVYFISQQFQQIILKKMSNYKKSSQTAKFNESELPTATKTNYYEASPVLNTPSLKSPSRFMQSKIQGVRDSIGSMINQISQKKNQNFEAVQRVKNVNADALAVMRDYQGEISTYTPKKSNRVSYPRENRTIGAVPSYDYDPVVREQGFMPQFNLQGEDYHQQIPQTRQAPQFKSLQQQNFQLRKALSEQIRVNGELLKRINFLQAQNNDLKQQLGHPQSKLRSTRVGNSYDDLSNEFSPVQRNNQYQYGKIGSSQNIRSSYNVKQPNFSTNYNDGYNSGGYSSSGNWAGNNNWGIANEASSLLAELDKLKRQNESLRQNTISLLQKN